MRNWHETERPKDAQRRAKTAAAPFTVGISKRPRGERKGEGEKGEWVTGGGGEGGRDDGVRGTGGGR